MSTAASPPRISRRARAVARRARRRRHVIDATRAVGVALAALALVGVPVPSSAPVLACGQERATTIVRLGELADDGELTALRERHLTDGTEPCETEVSDATDVAVAIVHQDAAGRSLETSELGRVDGPVDTRVSVRDTTARTEDLVVTGPAGVVSATRRIGVPQLVRITITYPSGWELGSARGDGVSVSILEDGVEVTRSGVLFPPLFATALQLTTTARPARGTPTVTVEATPLAQGAPVPSTLLDRDTTAVVGALLDVTRGGVRELADGAGQLADGTDALAGGARELADGTEELAAGARELADGTEGLVDGAAELRDGTRGLSRGVGQSAIGAEELAGGADALADGTSELAAGTAPLAAGARELAEGAQQLADGLAIDDELTSPPIDPQELLDAVDAIEDGIREVRDDLADLVPPGTDPTDPEDPNAPLAVAVLVLTGLADATGELAAGIAAALQALVDAAEGLAAAADGAAELAAGAQELAAGLAQLDAAVRGIRDGADALAAGSGELAGGLGQLSGASRQVADGASELTDGSRELAAGSDGLAAGSRELAAGSDDLADGSREVADGADELAEGAGELPAAVTDILEIADRGGERAAVTDAVLDAGARRASERVGEAELVTTQLVHRGGQPLPVVVLALGGLAVLVALGLPLWLWGRRREGSGPPTETEAGESTLAGVGGGDR